LRKKIIPVESVKRIIVGLFQVQIKILILKRILPSISTFKARPKKVSFLRLNKLRLGISVENDYKYIETNAPLSVKKPISRSNTWIENTSHPSIEIMSQKESASPYRTRIPTTPLKHTTPNNKLLREHQREKSISQPLAQSKNISYLQTPITTSPTHSQTLVTTTPDQVNIINQPPLNLSYTPSSTGAPTHNQVQLQLQLPLSLNPGGAAINSSFFSNNNPNMPIINFPQQTHFNSFVNTPFMYPQGQIHPQTTNMPQNCTYQQVHPHAGMYGNSQFFQPTSSSMYVGVPQNMYTGFQPVLNQQQMAQNVYFSNFPGTQTQMNRNSIISSNYIGMQADQSIVAQNNLGTLPFNSNYSTPVLTDVKEKVESTIQQKELKTNVKNYIKNQEELLKKLDEDKKKLVERLKNSPKVETYSNEKVEHVQSLVLDVSEANSEETTMLAKSYHNFSKSPRQNLPTKPFETISKNIKSNQSPREKDFENEAIRNSEKRIEQETNSLPTHLHKIAPEKEQIELEKPKVSAWESRKLQKSTQKVSFIKIKY